MLLRAIILSAASVVISIAFIATVSTETFARDAGLMERIGAGIFVREVSGFGTRDPAVEGIVVCQHRAASAHRLDQGRIGAADLMAVDVQPAVEPQ